MFRPKSYDSIEEAQRRPERVRVLVLHHARFKDVDGRLAQFRNLEELTFGWCDFERLPDDMASLKRLKRFICLNTPLRFLPDWLFDFLLLENLVIRGADIQEIPPAICKARRLQYVDFTNNDLRSVPHELGALRDLRHLGLGENSLEDLPPTITCLSQLRCLQLMSAPFSQPEAEKILGWFRPGVVSIWPAPKN